MILLLDNYDSFTWNLADVLRRKHDVRVVRNDQTTVREIERWKPKGILLSPGPGRPADAGISLEVVRAFMGKVPMLGVCLGHQLIGELLGAKLVHAPSPRHGKTSEVFHHGIGLFRGLPNPATMMRYHSLVLEPTSIPDVLEVSAWTSDREVMGIQHKILPLAGVQFHPESILSEKGEQILFNWMESL